MGYGHISWWIDLLQHMVVAGDVVVRKTDDWAQRYQANKQDGSDCRERLYTPGPWMADGKMVKASKTECWIANCNVSSFLPVEEMAFNSRLIACAPKMVEALKMAKRGLKDKKIDMEAYAAVIDALNAALGDSLPNVKSTHGARKESL